MPTEREKMLAGELYDPLDPELVAARERARDLVPGPQRHARSRPGRAAADLAGAVRRRRRRRLDSAAVLLRLRLEHLPRPASATSTSTASCSMSARSASATTRCSARRADLHGHAPDGSPSCAATQEFGKPVEIGSRRLGRRRRDHLPRRHDRLAHDHRRRQRRHARHPRRRLRRRQPVPRHSQARRPVTPRIAV